MPNCPGVGCVTDLQFLSESIPGARVTAPRALLDRRDERQLLANALRVAREGRGSAVVIRGEAGIGKSALLDDLADNAPDWCIGRVLGVESEMELPYAGLQRLCEPIIDRLGDLDPCHQDALETAFGRAGGTPPDRFLVGMAVLGLVACAARVHPLLWVIDDAQWLDRASVQTIVFVSHRVQHERVVVVMAARDTSDDLEFEGLPELRLGGLGVDEAGELFDSVAGPVDAAVRDRILAEARGNPLALLELPRAWTTAELVEGLSGSDRIPLSGKLELAFATRLAELPAATRTLLTLAAAEPKGDPALLCAAAERLGLDWSAAAPAELAGLIECGRRVYFRHPLVRAAAYRSAPIKERLEAHRALAEVTDPVRDADRRVWHRANSTVAHDEGIATELEHAATRAKARGGLLAAAAFLERAALLTPDGARRANRTLAAAKAKRDAGAPDAALRLLAAVKTEPPSELRDAMAEQLRGSIAFDQRRGREAAELLLCAAQRLERFDVKLARDAHLEAFVAAVRASNPDRGDLVRNAAQAARAAPTAHQSPQTADLLLDALATLVTQGYGSAATMLTRALAAVRDLDLGVDDVDGLGWLAGNRLSGILATEAWDFETGFALIERQVALARGSGALPELQFALNFLANEVLLTGDLRSAAQLIDEEHRLSTLTRVPPLGYTNLLLEAFRGDADRALPMISAKIDAATTDGAGRMVSYALWVSAVLYNGLGRHAEALACARRVVDGEVLGYRTLAAPELAEAASRTGDRATLAEISAWVRARAAATPTEWALGISAVVEALDADDADAEHRYLASIEHLGRTPLRIALARSHLLYGEWLRRRDRRGDAREQLEIAYDALNEMGIGAFAERARRELSATTGRRARRYLDAASLQLTAQEQQIAHLVKQGFSNREIGGRLFLSPRTIEWHLRNIFGKVGVSSRRQLRDKNLDPFLAPDSHSELREH